MIQNPMDFYNWQNMAREVLGNEFFDDLFKGVKNEGPAYNVYKSSSEIIILVNLPSVRDLSQINLTVKDQEIILKGTIELDFDHLEKVRADIFTGTFETKIPLPMVVHSKRVNASYQRGILTIQLFPKFRKDGVSVKIDEK